MKHNQVETTSTNLRPVELTLLFTGLIAVTYGFGIYLFSTLLPEMLNTLSFSYSEAGLMIGLPQVGFLLAALSSGFLARKVGASRLILGSVAICCLGLFSIGFAGSALVVGILLFILGTVAASVWVPMAEVVQRYIPKEHEAKALGLMSSGTAYGVFFNSLAIPALLPTYGWRALWIASAIIALVFSIWALVRLVHNEPNPELMKATEAAAAKITATTKDIFHQPITFIILAMMFLAGIACMPTQNYLVSFLRDDLGHSLVDATRAWSAIGIIGMVGGVVMGTVADRFSVYKSLFTTLLLLAVSITVFVAKMELTALYVAAAIFGLAFNAVFGLMPALVSANFREESATAIFGFGNVMLGLGSMAGNLLGGITKDLTASFDLIHLISLLATFLLLTLVWFASKASKTVTA